MRKMLQCFFIFHIADMLADESVVVAGQAEGIFQFRAAGQDLFRLEGQVNGIGGIAAGATQGHRLIFGHHKDAVIVAGVNTAVVHQKIIGDITQPVKGLIVIFGNRLFTEVGAGHHQGQAGFTQKQVVEWGVRQHHAQVFQVRSHIGSNV